MTMIRPIKDPLNLSGRGVTAVLGPTNTGKTHYAIERMVSHPTGVIGLPLRLLAREVYTRVCEKVGAENVALITGEEGERDRRVRFEKAPRFGLVGKPLDLTYRVLSTGGERSAVDVRVTINGILAKVDRAFIGAETPLQIVVPNAGRNIVELSMVFQTAWKWSANADWVRSANDWPKPAMRAPRASRI